MRKVFLISLVSYFLLNIFIQPLVETTIEESSYFWAITHNRSLRHGRYKYIFLGDSQIISGIDLEELSIALDIPQDNILVYSKPSQQMEGIELDLQFLSSIGISSDHYVINLSSTSTTTNPVYMSFKSLQMNFGVQSWRILFQPHLWKIFYKDVGSYLYHLLSEVFVLLKYNTNTTALFKIIPTVELAKNNSKKMNGHLEPALLKLLYEIQEQNRIMKSKAQEFGLWEWKNYSELITNSNCDINASLPELNPALQAAFSKPRQESIQSIERIRDRINHENSKLILIHIPFTESMRKIETAFPLIWGRLKINSNGMEFMEIPKSLFSDTDFNDYTHLKKCGAKKLSRYLGNQLNTNK